MRLQSCVGDTRRRGRDVRHCATISPVLQRSVEYTAESGQSRKSAPGEERTLHSSRFDLQRHLFNPGDGSKVELLLRQSIDLGLGEISNDRTLPPVHPGLRETYRVLQAPQLALQSDLESDRR
ncbi:hypothetical protein D3C72_2093740 [compost metagenome]